MCYFLLMILMLDRNYRHTVSLRPFLIFTVAASRTLVNARWLLRCAEMSSIWNQSSFKYTDFFTWLIAILASRPDLQRKERSTKMMVRKLSFFRRQHHRPSYFEVNMEKLLVMSVSSFSRHHKLPVFALKQESFLWHLSYDYGLRNSSIKHTRMIILHPLPLGTLK